MKSTCNIYDDRVKEINFYYAALEQLDFEVNELAEADKPKYRQDIFLKISKANALLMIYNLVESTVLNGIEEIYDKVRANGVTYSSIRQELQNIWFSYKFGQVYRQPESHYESYKKRAFEMVNSIIQEEAIELNRNALPISGNLNAEKIFKVCNSHGIDYKPDKSCKGGNRLEDVRLKRNGLAHGNLSFVECGREYSLSDLTEIKEQTYVFLSGLLDEMGKYYDSDSYLSKNVQREPTP